MTGSLVGKRIVNTRALHQAAALDRVLRLNGALPLSYPCIDFEPPEDTAMFDAALLNLSTGYYDWLSLTSVNTVYAVAERLTALNLSLPDQIFLTAAVGPVTAMVAKQHLHLNIVFIPATYDAESLATKLSVHSMSHVLLPESAIARPTLASAIRRRGAQITSVKAYQTICGHGGDEIPRLLSQQQVDAVTFTSSSTVTYFLQRFCSEGGKVEDALGLYIACIGPQTTSTAVNYGFSRVTTAIEHSSEGLVCALDTYFEQQK